MKLIITFGIVFLSLNWQPIFLQTNTDVVINELMSDNVTAVADEAGEFDDWIELYNNSNAPIDISGYGLSDDVEALGKFPIPENTIIPANGYLIIWADDDQDQGIFHAQFRLSSNGESVFLTDRNNQLIDEVNFPAIDADFAFARQPNGTGNFVIKPHSQGDDNDLVSSTLPILPGTITYGPNPTSDFLLIEFDAYDEIETVLLYDILGNQVYSAKGINQQMKIEMRGIPTGNYILKIGNYRGVLIQKMN